MRAPFKENFQIYQGEASRQAQVQMHQSPLPCPRQEGASGVEFTQLGLRASPAGAPRAFLVPPEASALHLVARPLPSAKGDPEQWGTPCWTPGLWVGCSACPTPGACLQLLPPSRPLCSLTEALEPLSRQALESRLGPISRHAGHHTGHLIPIPPPSPPPPRMQSRGPGKNSTTTLETRSRLHRYASLITLKLLILSVSIK